VRRLCLALALAASARLLGADALSPTASAALAASATAAASLSPTADTDAFWGRTPAPALQPPALPGSQANDPGEDFAVISCISLPFTGLYSAILVALAESVHQKHFPPSLSGGDTAAMGALALASSVTIAVVSVDWGPSPKALTRTAH
jgi:hypothetical protein